MPVPMFAPVLKMQCARLIEEFPDLVHFSAGDLLRDHIKSGTADGNMVRYANKVYKQRSMRQLMHL